MMKILLKALIFLCILFNSATYSQTGVSINTTGILPDSSAILDISDTTKGILIPRMALTITTSAAPVTAPATSLLIYNTASINDVTPGYYYWDSTKWVRLATGSGNCSSAPSAPVVNTASGVYPDHFTITWSSSSGATNYFLDIATDAAFTSFVSGYNNLQTGNTTQYIIYGLTYNTKYFYRVRAFNDCGTSSSSAADSISTRIYYIGDRSPSGGKIFYDKGTFSAGWRYLEAAPSDQSAGAQWGCSGTDIPGAAGTNIGTGKQNTLDIDGNCVTSGIAADLCTNADINGYTGWFLASQWESSEMYNKQSIIDNWVVAEYWTSSEVSTTTAFRMSTSGGFSNLAKTSNFRVRCIRSF